MLSISVMAAGQEGYYLDLSREDYYLTGGEPPGIWLGSGAHALTLGGKVEKAALHNLLLGDGPLGQPLVQHQNYKDGRARQPGWDFTFSAPKSVSVFWSQATPETRRLVEEFHLAAVREAFSYLETEAAVSRRGGGGERVESVGLVAAAFEHGTSRAQDPQLHTHVLIANAGLRSDGTWGTLRSRDLYQAKMAAGALYRAELSHLLGTKLGLVLRNERTWFEISAVPEPLLQEFSKRREAIEEALAKEGLEGARASEMLAKSTREVKAHLAREELFTNWQETGKRYRFGAEQVRQMIGQRFPEPVPFETLSLREAVQQGRAELLETQGFFSELELLRKTAEKLQAAGVSASAIRAAVGEELIALRGLRSLGVEAGQEVFTTPEIYAAETEFLKLATQRRESTAHLVGETLLRETFEARPTLQVEQREALSFLLRSPGAVQCVSGMAGTGKTFLLDAARAAWERQGFQVFGAALSARAARELEDGGAIASQTIARALLSLSKKLTSNSILVVDEAGMVGTRQMLELLRIVTERGAKLVLVGDERQLQAIEAGGPFRVLQEHLGSARLTSIARQHEEWMRDAVRQFADGDARGALTQYALAGRLHVEKNRATAAMRLVEMWSKRRTSDLSETLILAGTRDAVRELNRLAQSARKLAGELSPASVQVRGDTFHVGDRVLFTRNQPKLGVLNGERGTIETIHSLPFERSPHVTVRLDRPKAPGSRSSERVTLQLASVECELGYAMTVHKAQGATVDSAFVLGGGWMDNRELAYVEMSRARAETHIFVSTAEAGEDLEVLTQTMSRSRPKLLAHEISPTLHP